MNVVKKLAHTILSISGFVPEHMTFLRSFFMLGSVLLTVFVLPDFLYVNYAIAYFVFSTLVYLGFIFLILPENGLRLKMIEKMGEENAYLYYEGFLAFAFFHNGASLTFISQSSIGSGFLGDAPQVIVIAVVVILFVV